jgi:hypothetical protein
MAVLPNQPCFSNTCFDRIPATAAVIGQSDSIAVGADGPLLIGKTSGNSPNAVLQVKSPLPRFANDALADSPTHLQVASDDASEVYVFDLGGRHLATLDALSGAPKLEFRYEADGAQRLTAIVDHAGAGAPGAPVAGLLTTIVYPTAGERGTITSPFGDVTTFALDGNGNLSTVSRPAGPGVDETWTIEAEANGLMTSFRDRTGRRAATQPAHVGTSVRDSLAGIRASDQRSERAWRVRSLS